MSNLFGSFFYTKISPEYKLHKGRDLASSFSLLYNSKHNAKHLGGTH